MCSTKKNVQLDDRYPVFLQQKLFYRETCGYCGNILPHKAGVTEACCGEPWALMKGSNVLELIGATTGVAGG